MKSWWSLDALSVMFQETAVEVRVGWSVDLFAAHRKGGRISRENDTDGSEFLLLLFYFVLNSLQRKCISDADGSLTCAITLVR